MIETARTIFLISLETIWIPKVCRISITPRSSQSADPIKYSKMLRCESLFSHVSQLDAIAYYSAPKCNTCDAVHAAALVIGHVCRAALAVSQVQSGTWSASLTVPFPTAGQ